MLHLQTRLKHCSVGPCCAFLPAIFCRSSTRHVPRRPESVCTLHGVSTPCSTPKPFDVGRVNGFNTLKCQAGRRSFSPSAPGTLEAALHELARHSEQDKAATELVQGINRKLGGVWFLVSCGSFSSATLGAGLPAYALVQGLYLDVQEDITGQSEYKVDGLKVNINIQAQPRQHTFVYFIAYIVDSCGRLMGQCYNSPTAFEKLTTRKSYKKVLGSFRVIEGGQDVATLKTYLEVRLNLGKVRPVPLKLRHVVQAYIHKQLLGNGVDILFG